MQAKLHFLFLSRRSTFNGNSLKSDHLFIIRVASITSKNGFQLAEINFYVNSRLGGRRTDVQFFPQYLIYREMVLGTCETVGAGTFPA